MLEPSLSLLPVLLGGFCLSLVLEGMTLPALPGLAQRRLRDLAIHGGAWLLLFALGLLLVQRPVFAAALALAFLLLVVMVNNAKWHSLREPFLFADFEYFTDALKHPRLYIPFLGWWRALAATAGFLAAVYLGASLEDSRLAAWGPLRFAVHLGALILPGLVLLSWGLGGAVFLSFDPLVDLRTHGLAGFLVRYGWAERHQEFVGGMASSLPSRVSTAFRPNLVAIQSESFFDPRAWCTLIRPEVLTHFDHQKIGGAWGRLQVPAWGANTVRSEFGFLSGLAPENMGVHQFNPYRHLAATGTSLESLASLLQGAGYRTVFLHPYHRSFYARDRVMPLVGFDQFIDISAFSEDSRSGPYVGDGAVAEAIARILETATEQPLFVFAVTMENHGPLHLEKVLPEETRTYFREEPPEGYEDLTIYLRHLHNADAMVASLAALGERLSRETCFCFYGDHVPIMPKVYAARGCPDGHSNYLLWRSRGWEAGNRESISQEDLPVHQLARRFLMMAGLTDLEH